MLCSSVEFAAHSCERSTSSFQEEYSILNEGFGAVEAALDGGEARQIRAVVIACFAPTKPALLGCARVGCLAQMLAACDGAASRCIK